MLSHMKSNLITTHVDLSLLEFCWRWNLELPNTREIQIHSCRVVSTTIVVFWTFGLNPHRNPPNQALLTGHNSSDTSLTRVLHFMSFLNISGYVFTYHVVAVKHGYDDVAVLKK